MLYEHDGLINSMIPKSIDITFYKRNKKIEGNFFYLK